MRTRLVVALVAGLMAVGTVTAVAVPVPNPDPCAISGSLTDAKHQAYMKCRFDRIEQAIPGNQTVTVTATPAPVTVTAAPVTVTVTAGATLTPSSSTSPSPSTSQSPATTTPATPGAVPADTPGWALNEHNVGLEPLGLACDTLPRYTGSMRPTAGTVITEKLIVGNLDLRQGDITVERSCIRPDAASGWGLVTNYVCGADDCPVISDKTIIIRDSEFDATAAPASGIAGTCAFRGVGTLQRNYMHGMGSGICFYGTGMKHDGIAEQNYVTDLRSSGDSHNEAATLRDFMRDQNPARVARFTNNRFRIIDGNVTAGLFIQPTWDDIDNVTVEGNLIEGGGFNLYLNRAHGSYQDTHAVNNRFNPINAWGPVAVDPGPEFTEWRDNYLYDPNQPDAKGRAVIQ